MLIGQETVPSAIVADGGIGGLEAALSLAKKGCRVMVLNRLEARKLVTCSSLSEDKRIKRLKLTAAGRSTIDRAESAVLRAQESILTPLQPKHRDKLMELLGQLVELNNAASLVLQRVAG